MVASRYNPLKMEKYLNRQLSLSLLCKILKEHGYTSLEDADDDYTITTSQTNSHFYITAKLTDDRFDELRRIFNIKDRLLIISVLFIVFIFAYLFVKYVKDPFDILIIPLYLPISILIYRLILDKIIIPRYPIAHICSRKSIWDAKRRTISIISYKLSLVSS